MSRHRGALRSVEEASPALRQKVETYRDQGGLLGTFTYVFTYLETEDPDLAATLATIPTDLFVTSALHDDAIDEADSWDADRKCRLNEHVTVGDLVYTNVVEAVSDAAVGIDLGPTLEVVREIGTGQLAEEAVEATPSTEEDAVARVEDRGGVWGDLAVELVAAAGRYSSSQLEALRTIATNSLFVLTVIDDLADLPEDIGNDVATLPLLCFGERADEYASPRALIDAVLASDVPDRLADLVARRRAAIRTAVAELWDSIDHSDEALLEATDRALEWYCESVCSVPIAETVPAEQRRAIRERLTGDEEPRRRYIAAHLARLPVAVPADDAAAVVSDLPADRLARTAVRIHHLDSVVDSVLSTTLEDALADLRAASASTS
ncbi:class 1 isoprenoid biosynthesis enzyme [Natrinema caseinilyticum]|uniref:class 1 isoprenoid biosynthesis enzyme n=1 Tax=Natrinema caseinilyticum TaxID=2961570 RepID=UPI0020C57C9C|nr:class 1 isoprenoid biosynthesis enzyme [Natrinema caseinilyticum]